MQRLTCQIRKAILFILTGFILISSTENYASDGSVIPPQELDTRPDDVLVKLARTEVKGTWYSTVPGYEPTIISNHQFRVDRSCSVNYSIVRTTVGSTVPDEHEVTGAPIILKQGRAVSIKLKLEKSKCLRGDFFGFTQFTFYTTSEGGIFNFASVVDYDANDHARSWYHLTKLHVHDK